MGSGEIYTGVVRTPPAGGLIVPFASALLVPASHVVDSRAA
jgi:hypothetical protein